MEKCRNITMSLLFIPFGVAFEFWEFLKGSWEGISYSFTEIRDEWNR